MATFRRFAVTLCAAGALVAVGVILASHQLGAAFAGGKETADTDALVQVQGFSQRSVVYDRSGGVLAILHAEENRSPVPLAAVPKHVVDAILDVEDADFYSHGGVNLRAALRALSTNVQSGDVRQGGSTITQQLVKNALLTPERDLERKAKEAVLALRLEDQMSKDQILEQYLNTVYFGSGAYGVQAAAETYFGIEVAKLTPGQAALLAGVIRNPVGYDPTRFPDVARERRALALERMVARAHLTPAEAEKYKAEPIPEKRLTPPLTPNDFFIEEVKQQLLEDTRLGETPQERYNAVFKGGLRITTTLDTRMQQAAEASVAAGLPKSFKGKFTAALLSLDPRNGAVRAMVAGEDFKAEQTNLATGRGGSGRQPGSSFKPFVLAAAYENGYGPEDTVDGREPCKTVRKGRTPEEYDPGNYEGSAGSVTTLNKATAQSMNCAYIRLGLAVGLPKVVDTTKRLGINQDLQPIDSLPLGSAEVTPQQMAAAYGTFAADGTYHAPTFVEKVERADGKVLVDGTRKGEERVSPQVARLVTRTLQGVVTGGTGTRARIPGREVAGKTGTSNNSENVWFVGYTPQLSTAVWIGSPSGNVSMGKATGGVLAAPIWRSYTAAALEGAPPIGFPAPDPRLIPKRKMVKETDTVRGKTTTTVKKKATVRRAPARRPTATTTRPRPRPRPRPTATTAPSTATSTPPTTDRKGGDG